jgi:hypothetical protein
MARKEQRDRREYHIVTPTVNTNAIAETKFWIPIPAAGTIVRCMAGCQVVANGTADITFALGGASLVSGGSSAVLELPTDAVGSTRTIEFDPDDPANLAYEAEDGDLIAERAVLTIDTDAGSTTGWHNFVITVRP